MISVHIVRTNYKKDRTLGRLYVAQDEENELFSCKTLELPWKDNKRRVSCIPEGKYPMRHREGHESLNFNYPHFHIERVPGRYHILIHRGNFVHQILGCILVGEDYVDFGGGSRGVTNSAKTLRKLREIIPASTHINIYSVRQSKRPKKMPRIEAMGMRVEIISPEDIPQHLRNLDGARLL